MESETPETNMKMEIIEYEYRTNTQRIRYENGYLPQHNAA
jgi:hypothetical protein